MMHKRFLLLVVLLIVCCVSFIFHQYAMAAQFTPGYLVQVREIYPMRTGPSEDAPILLYPPGQGEIWLQKGEKVGLIDIKGDWLYLKHNNVVGFAEKKVFIQLDEKFEIHPSLVVKFYFQEEERKQIKIATIILSLKEQVIKAYDEKGKLLAKGYCVTGKTGRETRQGNWEIYQKESPRYLSGPGYCLPVTYWMPFYGGQGLHDAYWRTFLGPWEDHSRYGSRGCVNLVYPMAEFLYFHSNAGTKVIVTE